MQVGDRVKVLETVITNGATEAEITHISSGQYQWVIEFEDEDGLLDMISVYDYEIAPLTYKIPNYLGG